MKIINRLMWIFAIIPTVITGVAIQFMPDEIPMHYDAEGNIDRWGNKMESFIVPGIILIVALFWQLLILYYKKKADKATAEKEQVSAKSSAKLLAIVGLSETIIFGIENCFILYSSYSEAKSGATQASIDITKVVCILFGIMLIVLGNFMTKTRKNAVAGVRTIWSMYNDNTWRKSNFFGAICVIAAGVLTVITSAIANGNLSTILMIVYIIFAAILSVVYSKIVYDAEKKKEE